MLNGGPCARGSGARAVQEAPRAAPLPAHPSARARGPVRERRVQEAQDRGPGGGQELHDGVAELQAHPSDPDPGGRGPAAQFSHVRGQPFRGTTQELSRRTNGPAVRTHAGVHQTQQPVQHRGGHFLQVTGQNWDFHNTVGATDERQ